VTLAIDVMAINKIPFLVTTSTDIHFCTAELLRDKMTRKFMTSIRQVVQAYHAKYTSGRF